MAKTKTAKKKTPERILDTALEMFNEEGEPHVTTNAISDEMDISPGNLHYHFKSKGDLVDALFERFYRQLSDLIVLDDDQALDLVEAWMRILVLFELMWAYRFAYRDLAQLQVKYPSIRRQTARLLHRKISVAEQGCDIFGVPNDDAEALARNMIVVMTYWLSFELACGVEGEDHSRFARGAYQVTTLLLPYLDEESKQTLRQLAGEYL